MRFTGRFDISCACRQLRLLSMTEDLPTSSIQSPNGSQFPTTPWTMLNLVGGGDTLAGEALSDLCEMYWYPLYAYARRRGFGMDDAQDHTQIFLTNVSRG